MFYVAILLVTSVAVSLWFGAGGSTLFRFKVTPDHEGPPGSTDPHLSDDPNAPESGDRMQLKGYTIAVDPGHGGADRGVCHFPDDLIEKEINLDMAVRLKKALEQRGADVFLTRDDDVYVSLDARAEVANAGGAHVFISLHVNRMPGHPGCFGAQTFYFPGSEPGKKLALALQNELVKVDPENYRTPLSGSFKVLRLAEMVGALVEIAFMTNERDRALLQADEYRDNIAGAIVSGLIHYVEAEMAGDAG